MQKAGAKFSAPAFLLLNLILMSDYDFPGFAAFITAYL
jgi:hypothetical protein